MEEPKSILLTDIASNGAHAMQQSLQNGNHSKLIETENRLNQVFEEYSGRIESFMMMLDHLKEGIVIISKTSEIYYTNEAGNTFIKKSGAEKPGFMFYRNLFAEETILPDDDYRSLLIRANNFFWNGEQCNIFFLEEKEVIVLAAEKQTLADSSNEPFDTLISYVKKIAEHETTGTSGEVTRIAELANKTVVQSEKLLGDLKTFISLANTAPVPTAFSMQKIVGDVLKFMGPEIEDAAIEVSVSELPETIADKELIVKLLKQLIGNALKFRNRNRKAIIDIGHDKSDGQFTFCVRDNGIGISKKHHKEVFAPFVSLNNPVEFPGNGLGLAICKKIVELHNGQIWVESLPGHGSNFYFRLNVK